MRLSQVSTQTLFGSLHRSVSQLQRALNDANTQVATGSVSDAGLHLGTLSARRATLLSDTVRLDAIIQSNNLAQNRLSVSIGALQTVGTIGQELQSALIAGRDSDGTNSLTSLAGRDAARAIADVLNTTVRNEAVFGGINSDSQPLVSLTDGSAANALDLAFQSHFGFSKTSPLAQSITGAAMQGFLDTVISPMFTGAAWQTNFSTADDNPIQVRISSDESLNGSVTANEEAIQNLSQAALLAGEFLTGSLAGEARKILVDKSIELLGNSNHQLADLQGKVGLTLNRISATSEHLQTQADVLEEQSSSMTRVDPYEAATRVNLLLTQIETSYTLTGRMQQLSLMRFI